MKLDVRAENQPRLSREQIQEILDQISLGPVLYQDYRFRLIESDGIFLLQLVYREQDCDTLEMSEQHARKWFISAHSTTTEIVRTAYKAVLCSLEHRLGEWFTYDGRRVYSPHRSVE